uniref:Uncharacterized protein n=1 Tax=Zea mays TaxID=4577 RepID=C4J8L4_MAIZE|nr:unknown [Zea mays]
MRTLPWMAVNTHLEPIIATVIHDITYYTWHGNSRYYIKSTDFMKIREGACSGMFRSSSLFCNLVLRFRQQIAQGDDRSLGASTLFNRLEFLQLLEVLPWLLPDLSFIELIDFAILHFNSEIVHRASNHLCLGLHKLLEPQKSIGLLVVLIDGEARELLELEVVLVRRHVLDAACQHPGVVSRGLLLCAARGGNGGEGKQHE